MTDARTKVARTKVVVVGGGVGGATAALRLAQQGHRVTLLEAGSRLGGLVVSFEVQGTPLECFYHHVFPHETDIQALIDELGLRDHLDWRRGTMGVFTGDRIWPFTTPADLLRFRPLPLVDRIRAGLGALKLRRPADWERLDSVPARQWLEAACGPRATTVLWDPLLRAKFSSAAEGVPAAWMYGRFRQRSGARRAAAANEKLGYLRGGFRQLFDALHDRLVALGVEVRVATRARSIELDGDHVRGVETDNGPIEADAVLYCGTLPGLPDLLPADRLDERWREIGTLGAVCVVLELDRPIAPVYWTNVCDPALPFGAIIEHTNLLPAADYGGRHVVYLGRYFTTGESLATVDLAAETKRWIDALADRLSTFDTNAVLAAHPFRTPYAAPLVQLGHLGRIPPARTHLTGLYLATTAQIYPDDRGMSEGVRLGTRVAGLVHEDAATLTRGRTR